MAVRVKAVKVGERDIVCVADAAVDHERSRIEEYEEAGHPSNWRDYLVLAEDEEHNVEEPTVFRVRPLSYEEMSEISAEGSWFENLPGSKGGKKKKTVGKTDNLRIAGQAFRVGVVGWKNLMQEQGEALVPLEVDLDPITRRLSKRQFDLLWAWVPDIVMELGGVILKESSSNKHQKK